MTEQRRKYLLDKLKIHEGSLKDFWEEWKKGQGFGPWSARDVCKKFEKTKKSFEDVIEELGDKAPMESRLFLEEIESQKGECKVFGGR